MADTETTLRIISRKDARKEGLKHYFTGVPCKRGHVALRYTSYCMCVECAQILLRISRARDPGRNRAVDRRWKNKNRKKMQSRYRERYAENPTKYIGKTKRYYEKNGEKVRTRRKAYHYQIYTREEVRVKAQQRTKQWAKDNPDQARTNARNGKAHRKAREGVVVGTHTATDIADIFRRQYGRCGYCKRKLVGRYDVDHIIALSRGGTNFRRNLQLLCHACNLQKHARDPIDHARMLGLLL